MFHGRSYSDDLEAFAKDVEGERGFETESRARSAKPFNGRELLLLCALYKVTPFPTEVVNLFKILSKRSEEDVKEKFRKMQLELSQ